LRLQTKILLLLVPLIVLPILSLGWATYSQLKDEARNRTQGQMTALLEQIQFHTESLLQTARANASLFANTELVKSYVRHDPASTQPAAQEYEVLDLLFNYQQAYPEYYEIRILSPRGKEILRSAFGDVGNVETDEALSNYFLKSRSQPDITYTTFFRNPDNNQPALLVSKPLTYFADESNTHDSVKKLYGFLMLTIDLDFLGKQTRNKKTGKSGQLFFTDSSGTILFHPSEARIGKTIGPQLFRKLKSSINSKTPVAGEYNNQAVNFQGGKLHDWLYVFTAYPERELFANNSGRRWSFAILTLSAILLTTAFLYSALKILLIKPIQQLSHAASEMGRGKLLVPIDVDSNDEIGDLANTFKEMGENLNHYHEQVRYVAYHDSLTGLPNRKMFKDYLTRATAEAHRNFQKLAILFLDLDNFKRINDTMGHHAGDKLLKLFADRLSESLRKTDVISHAVNEGASELLARLAGDEFIILMPRTAGSADAQKVAKRILDSLSAPFRINQQDAYVSTSIGIALFPDDGVDSNELLKSADIAMYSAKKLGRNNYQYYSRKMNDEAVYKLMVESHLRHAVENNELELYYQPQMKLSSGLIVGVESLLRWNHDELGQVSPDIFIPIAEEYGLIVPISKWVIQEACRQAKAWQAYNFNGFTLSINISAVHFNGHELETELAKHLQVTGLHPKYIELELTETSILQDPELAINSLNALKEMGLQISLDDFGTGFSSLSYVMKLPVDKIKIDRSFIQNMENDTDAAAIVSAIIAMAHSLNLSVIAEGVEKEAHVQLLGKMQCDIIQGYHFSRPLPASEFEQMIISHQERRA
jgi:diguanylate cyclase (GGDEF)-like protein